MPRTPITGPQGLELPAPVVLYNEDGTPTFPATGEAFSAILFANTSGASVEVAAVAGRRIKVLAYDLVCAAAVNVKWQSAGTDISGLQAFGANGGKVCNFNPSGWFTTVVSEALNINLSAAVQVGGTIVYDLV